MAEYRQNVSYKQIMKEGGGRRFAGREAFFREYRLAVRALQKVSNPAA